MRIAYDSFLAQFGETTLYERAQRLVIERGLPQELRRAYRFFQLRNRIQKFGLPRRASSQLFDFTRVDAARGLDEQLFFPADFRAPDHLRQHTAHHRFDRAAIVGADPPRQFEQLLAQDRRISDDRFDGPDAFGFALLGDRNDCCQRRFIPERHPHARADSDARG